MFNYYIKDRALDANGVPIVGPFYSGHGEGRDNPDLADIPDFGPIPPGRYRIGQAITHPKLGDLAMPLIPLPGTDTLGRSGFYIHGDSRAHPGEASHGCLIAPRDVRLKISASRDRILDVAAERPAPALVA